MKVEHLARYYCLELEDYDTEEYDCIEIILDDTPVILVLTDMFNQEMTERIVNVVEDALKKMRTVYEVENA